LQFYVAYLTPALLSWMSFSEVTFAPLPAFFLGMFSFLFAVSYLLPEIRASVAISTDSPSFLSTPSPCLQPTPARLLDGLSMVQISVQAPLLNATFFPYINIAPPVKALSPD